MTLNPTYPGENTLVNIHLLYWDLLCYYTQGVL